MSNVRFMFVGALILLLLSMCFDSDVGFCLAEPTILGLTALSGGMSLANGLIGNSLSRSNARYQANLQKDLMDYQWNKYGSPSAQAKSLSEAGLNPSVVFGQGSISHTAMPNVSAPAISPVDVGLSGADIPSSILALAQAKKAGIDTSLGEEDIKLKQIQQERDQFELDLRQRFGLDRSAADLALARENVNLAKLSGDKIELEKAVLQYTKAKEKAISECEENRRDILKKELLNTDKRLKLENRVLSTQGDANIASANASNTQAAVNRENRRLQGALADIEESGKDAKVKALLSEYQKQGALSESDKKEAELRLSRLTATEDKRSSSFFRETDNFFEWLKDKVSIFKSK